MASKGKDLDFGCLLFCCLLLRLAYSETDTLLQGQKLKHGGQLVSAFGTFRLGFFGKGEKSYIGIFYRYGSDYGSQGSAYSYDNPRSSNYYNTYRVHDDAVWVANLNHPIHDKSGVLTIGSDGNLKILHGSGNPFPLSSANVSGNTSATLLETGNLVLNELNPDGSVKRSLWESFDYPTDTLIPGMKLGINLRNGHAWSLKSGAFTLGLDPNHMNQLVIWLAGDVYWTSGAWLNGKFNLSDQLISKYFRFSYVTNEEEKYFMYEVEGNTISAPMLVLSKYGYFADSSSSIHISCGLETYHGEFVWAGSSGCVTEDKTCRKDPKTFFYKEGLVSEDAFKFNESYNLDFSVCRMICERNCSCVAFAPTNEVDYSGCQIWSSVSVETSRGENLQGAYVFANTNLTPFQEHKVKWLVWLLVALGAALASPLLCFVISTMWKRYVKSFMVKCKVYFIVMFDALKKGAGYVGKRCEKKLAQYIQSLMEYEIEQEIPLMELGIDTNGSGEGRNELQFLSFESIALATNNFSSTNRLGEGGFGPVYKGQLPDGQEVAIKRLSRNSNQGLAEFNNEVKVIAKLQHNNLVRLLGCCIEREEKMLIYEYMPNKSLDFFLFDPQNQTVLDWKKRLNIIEGISQGLLYLHKYSRLKIIHRDLKASNILLDSEMNPKISDFGMAKIFGPDESKANTLRVVGTLGYISPEYAIDGLFSTKSDVFSFGILLLEIVSGRKNTSFHYSDSYPSLTAFAWELWKQGKELDLIDPVLGESVNQNEALRCIHVGLLCVQENPTDRPTMLDVISMLYNEAYQLAPAKEPAFYYRIRNFHTGMDVAEQNEAHITLNDVSITEMEAR